MKNTHTLLLILILMISLAACSGNALSPEDGAFVSQPAVEVAVENDTTGPTTQNLDPLNVAYDSDDLAAGTESAELTTIQLADDSITVAGSGATVEGSIVTITAAGTYQISGTLDDGQIIVNSAAKEKVNLVLNGVNLTSSTSAPIYVANAEKTVITLAAGTDNYVTDGTAYVYAEAETDEPNAAIFSHDDLTLNGAGSLAVTANYHNGIASKDDLKITGGQITVTAVNDGLKGKDSIAIKDGLLTIEAGGDGLQAHNDSDVAEGYIAIEGGTLNVTAGLDGVQAETQLLVSGGEISLTTGGGSGNSSFLAGWGLWGGGDDDDSASAKGLKAGVEVALTGGTITIDSSDDAIHSNQSVTLDGGSLRLASGDDGIHADAALEINGGDLTISQSYEGLESAVITLNDGTIHLTASDDGINVAGGNDGSSTNGRPGQNEFAASDAYHLYLNGGTLVVDAGGDGLDSNGFMDMTGGLVIVNGPTTNGNGPLDYNGTFNLSGGTLVAVGSSGMAQAPSATSTQSAVLYNFDATQAAGTPVHIGSAAGAEVLTFVPNKEYQSVLLSSPELAKGETYVVYTGGRATGSATDGLYVDGVYTAGSEVASLTLSSVVTTGGVQGGGPGGGGRFGGGPPPGGRP